MQEATIVTTRRIGSLVTVQDSEAPARPWALGPVSGAVIVHADHARGAGTRLWPYHEQ